MQVVVQHRISDPEEFFSADAQEVAENAPSGVQARQFFPSQDRSTAVCLWEGDSIDAVRSEGTPPILGALRSHGGASC